MKTDIVLWFKGACAFVIPAAMVVVTAPVFDYKIKAAIIVAGASGLSSWLSRTFADAKDAQDAISNSQTDLTVKPTAVISVTQTTQPATLKG